MRTLRNNIFFILSYVVVMACPATANVIPERYQRGEVVHYDIKKVGLRVGSASLTYHGPVEVKGGQFILITFKAQAMKFYDEERIYLHPQTFYPMRVERDLNIWGKKEKIVEEYDQAKGIVRINKRVGEERTTLVIEKKSVIDNVYAFIYRYRESGHFVMNETMNLSLPTKQVKIKVLDKRTFSTAGQDFEAYYMQSEPKQYKLWFDTSPQRIPLRIDGAIGIGKASLIMQSYHPYGE